MKISTDSVLIGSWAKKMRARKILDIGTGSGVIALMLAQRTSAHIDAIDVSEDAYLQASKNFSDSKWNNKLTAHHCPLQKYSPQIKYDLIVSNPPYFELPQVHNRKEDIKARYTHELSFADLAEGVVKLLHSDGRFCVIFPVHEGAAFTNEAEKRNLFLTKFIWVKTTDKKKFPKRILMEFEFAEKKLIRESMLIIQNGSRYTNEYRNLTKDYFLKF